MGSLAGIAVALGTVWSIVDFTITASAGVYMVNKWYKSRKDKS